MTSGDIDMKTAFYKWDWTYTITYTYTIYTYTICNNNYLHVQVRRKMLWQQVIDVDAVETSYYPVPVYVVVQLQLHWAFQKTRDSP